MNLALCSSLIAGSLSNTKKNCEEAHAHIAGHAPADQTFIAGCQTLTHKHPLVVCVSLAL